MRSVFFGTPAIAVPALQALHRSSELLGVVCQPDRPKGRGMALAAPEVKLAAQELGVAVYQPEKVRNGELERWLLEQQVDVAVVLAYGRILPDPVLAAPRHGCLNLHASLLPRYRGAAPIQWAVMHGDTETGISLMQMDSGLDTGPVYTTRSCPIPGDMNAEGLALALSELAATMVLQDLPRALNGELRATPQDPALASFAPPLTREHAALDWTRSARELSNQVRALSPRPGAVTLAGGKRLRVLATEFAHGLGAPRPSPSSPSDSRIEPANAARGLLEQAPPGQIVHASGDQVWVATGDGLLRIVQAQLEGKKVASARELINGRALQVGLQFESLTEPPSAAGAPPPANAAAPGARGAK